MSSGTALSEGAERKLPTEFLRGNTSCSIHTSATNIIASAANLPAFDACPDFSKLNAGRHNGSRADTFNTPPSLVKPARGPVGGGGRQSAGPTRELLDVFEMGVARSLANLRNEVREELQTATEILRADVLRALSDMRGIQLLKGIDKKVDEIKLGPVNVDLSVVIEDIRMMHASIRDAMTNSTGSILRHTAQTSTNANEELMECLTAQSKAAEKHHDVATQFLDEAERRLDAKLKTAISLQQSLHKASSKFSEEVHDMHRQDQMQQDRAERAVAATEQRDAVLAESLGRLQQDLSELQNSQRSLRQSHTHHVSISEGIQKECINFTAELVPRLQNELARDAHDVTVDMAPVLNQVEKAYDTLVTQFPHLLYEVSRVQEALNIDFIQGLGDDVKKAAGDPGLSEEVVKKLVPVMCNTQCVRPVEDHDALDDEFTAAVPTAPVQRRPRLSIDLLDEESPSTPETTGSAFLKKLLTRSQTAVGCELSTTSTMAHRLSTDGLVKDAACSARLKLAFGETMSPLSSDKNGNYRRVRHYWSQTASTEHVETSVQTDDVPVVMHPAAIASEARRRKRSKEKGGSMNSMPKALNVQRRRSQQILKPVFADSESMKQRARQALIRPQYHVSDYYHQTGWARTIAVHGVFEYVTLAIIFMNAVWIAIDADLNPGFSLLDSPPLFVVGENIFCVYFCVELLIRFLAFGRKRNAIKDGWFVFDSILVALMVIETWVLTLIMYLAGGTNTSSISNMSLFRMVRMVKMLRISRMARLLRGMPELFILMKGIKAASRSVVLFFVLWTFIIYVYSLVFRMTYDSFSPGATQYFDNVPGVMNLLLLNGVLPMHSTFVKGVASESWIYWPIAVSFIALSFVLLMNMLVGVLVEVVSAIASTEREGITVVTLATDLRACVHNLGIDTERSLSKEDVEVVIGDSEVALVVDQSGSDIVALADMLHVVFEDLGDEDGNISFADFVETILNMRGTNPAKVKDVKEQLRAIKVAIHHSESTIRHYIFDELNEIRTAFNELRGEVMSSTHDDMSTVWSFDRGERCSTTGSANSAEQDPRVLAAVAARQAWPSYPSR